MKDMKRHAINTAAGWWIPAEEPPETTAEAIRSAIADVNRPVILIREPDRLAACRGGTLMMGVAEKPAKDAQPLCAFAPPLPPGNLGDPLFKKRHGLDYAYVIGAMANGITSVEMVEAAGRNGFVAFFGSAGLSPAEIEAAVDRLQRSAPPFPFGCNLIHSPNEPEMETQVADLFIRRRVRLVSASAYMDMTPALIYYRVKGIHRDAQGGIVCPNRVIAKVSRIEVARKFFSPPPEKVLRLLLERKMITPAESELAAHIPVAEDMTAEADSGGHTDNRPAISLLPVMLALRDEMAAVHGYPRPLFVGLGGGIATPDAAAAAFAMGAAYVLTGSVNQACVEAGTSAAVRQMLARAEQADVVMAPAADMFEMGVKVQVLKRGTMFPFRAARLYDLYQRYGAYADIPPNERALVERDIFQGSFEEAWEQTRRFFSLRDPGQIRRAEADPKHQMALVFRSYLGRSSGWANAGEPSRRLDYQIWCGPAMGAFNQWTRGSFLERPENRKTVAVAFNLLLGAAVTTRVNWLRCQGVDLPAGAGRFAPMPLETIREILAGQEAAG